MDGLQVESDDDKVVIRAQDGTSYLFENATLVPLVANKNQCDELLAQYKIEAEQLGTYTLMRHRFPDPKVPSYRILFLANGFEIRFRGLMGAPAMLVVPSTQCLPQVPRHHLVFQNMPVLD